MDIRKIKKLIEMLEESNLTEIEIREGEETIRLSRQGIPVAINYPPAHVTHPQAQNMAHAPAPAPPAAPTAPAAVEAKPEPKGHAVRSPMVGTFYASSAPGAAPFVKKGQQVKVGDVLCVIEAMKMFNQIEADAAGTVSEILAENGAPVEFDQPLFVIS
jgi:acetyl-CoA carboxylase biotin carboxyl carrier protein